MITCDHETIQFGAKRAVDDLTFSIKENGVIGLLGPNGAGKTTTMRLLIGHLSPTSGTVSIFYKNPKTDRIETLSQIGYLAENNPLYPEMRVLEYLQFVSCMKNADLPPDLFSQVNIESVLNTRIEELSRGIKQRVGLAAALIGNPKLLILDEPTSGLDPIEQEKIQQLILNRAHNTTILLSTHILSEVEHISTRLLMIDHGKLVYDGKTPKEKGAVEALFKKHIAI